MFLVGQPPPKQKGDLSRGVPFRGDCKKRHIQCFSTQTHWLRRPLPALNAQLTPAARAPSHISLARVFRATNPWDDFQRKESTRLPRRHRVFFLFSEPQTSGAPVFEKPSRGFSGGRAEIMLQSFWLVAFLGVMLVLLAFLWYRQSIKQRTDAPRLVLNLGLCRRQARLGQWRLEVFEVPGRGAIERGSSSHSVGH